MAGGRYNGKTVSDAVVTHVPVQDGIDHDVYYRHELIYADGQHQRCRSVGLCPSRLCLRSCRGRSTPSCPSLGSCKGCGFRGSTEYSDGDVGGGSFWQGRDNLAFGPGYQLKAGVTTTHDDIVATPTFDDAGKMTALDAQIGSDSFTFAFDSSGSPLHFFGRLTSSSLKTHPTRSWCWVEYAGGMMTGDILDMMNLQFSLARGR